MIKGYFTVTSLNVYIKEVLENDSNLSNLSLRAEISSFKRQIPSGHCYITLKDENSVINAVMFQRSASKLTFEPKEGDDVMLTGSISSYPQRGQYQLYVTDMTLFGQGAQLLELEKLKKKLAAEGLFDESRKRKINRFPKNIGIITANHSAALSDLVKNISRRYPFTNIYLFPSLVQGNDAPKDLLRAFKLSQNYELDTLIIGRGGGSNEDLSAFNDEALVRALAESKCPTISAVGHEIDITLTDFVCDKRVSTPTAAAELATYDIIDIENQICDDSERIEIALSNKIYRLKSKLEISKNHQFFISPKSIYSDKLNDIKQINYKLETLIKNLIAIKKQEINLKRSHLYSVDPKSVLSRGYSISKNKDGKIIKSIKDLKTNENITVAYYDGDVNAIVTDVKER